MAVLTLREKLPYLAILVGFVYFLPDEYLFSSFIITGQAHFALSYYYQYQKGTALLPPVLYAILLMVGFLLAKVFHVYFMNLVMVLFTYHHFLDEMKVESRKVGLLHHLAIFPVVLFMVVPEYISVDAYPVLQVFLVSPLAILLLQHARSKITSFDIYLCLFTTIIGVLMFYVQVGFMHVWAFIVLTHIVMWYLYAGKRLYHNSSKDGFLAYIRNVLLVNIVVFMMWYYLETTSVLAPFHYVFFAPICFHVWTLMHIISTFRKSDYQRSTSILRSGS